MSLVTRVPGSAFFLTNNCYCKLTAKRTSTKLYKRHISKVLARSGPSYNLRQFCTPVPNVQSSEKSYIAYDELLALRRSEARRSIIIQVLSDKSCADVYTYCSQFTDIKNMFHYTALSMEGYRKKERHFVLIELQDEDSVNKILSQATHSNDSHIIPAYSSMLYFRNGAPFHSQLKKLKNANNEQIKIMKNCCKISSDVEIFKKLANVQSISDQMMILYNSSKLSDVGARLRFFTAYQIECFFHGLFPNVAVLPFGSTVNGFGKQGCDLDLSLTLDSNKVEKSSSRLVFQTKSLSLNERFCIEKLLDTIAESINIFVPGVSNVRKILRARVPIIKIDHSLCGIECDIAMTNMSAYYMSELLYVYGEIDWRVRPLTFVIRKWAENLNLTNKVAPGPWITNFSITLMVLFYLQNKKILPALDYLTTQATKEDVRVADGSIDCTFQRDISKIPKTKNTDSLEKLLVNFFTFYGNFDFSTKALSLRLGRAIPKSENSALYICNPLETSLNVSKNVNYEELNRIKMAMRSASWMLETSDNDNSDNWGLISLFMNKYLDQKFMNKKGLDIQSLFASDDSFEPNNKHSSKKRY